MRQVQRGITLIEILVAAVIAAVVVGGTMTAFLSATKVSKISSEEVGSAADAQQTIERVRNKSACRQSTELATDTWFDSACAPAAPSGLKDDGDTSGSSDISVSSKIPGATRQYEVVAADCNGNGLTTDGIDDCLQVTSTVHWTPAQ